MAKRNTYNDDEELTQKFNGKMLKKALRYAIPYKKVALTIAIGMVIVGIIVLIPAKLNQFIIDDVLTKKGAIGLDWKRLLILLLTIWAGIILIDIVFAFCRLNFMSKVGHSILRDIRRDAFCNLQRLAYDYYDSRPMGKILVRVTSYLDEISQIFSTALLIACVDGLKILMIFVLLYITDWRLAIVVTVVVIPMAILLMILRKSVMMWGRKQRNKDSNRTAYIAESIQGVFVTKAFNRTNKNIEIYRGIAKASTDNWLSIVRRQQLFVPISDGFFMLGTIAVYFAALVLIKNLIPGLGGMTVGTIVAFVSYMSMFSAPINNIAATLQQILNAASNLERVFEVCETPPSIYDCSDAYDLPEVLGDVKFENVTFGYDNDKNILENINLEVPKGKMIALVGPTGAGKTTVVSLISRFYDIKEGSIFIDGHDISKVKLHSLRSQVGVMMQDSFIFSGTILENIRYARPNASVEDCIEAAKKAHAHDFIMSLQDGYNTKTLEQGVGLSTGERQLLSFARVLLADPKILILDEATSSIDTETEAKIKDVLDTILVGRTSFVIAHRLSTIRKADCILYIENKGIAECGTHKQLMEKQGRYYNLVTMH